MVLIAFQESILIHNRVVSLSLRRAAVSSSRCATFSFSRRTAVLSSCRLLTAPPSCCLVAPAGCFIASRRATISSSRCAAALLSSCCLLTAPPSCCLVAPASCCVAKDRTEGGTTSNISRSNYHLIGSSPIAVRPINNSSGERRVAVYSSPATSKTLSFLPEHTTKTYAESLPLRLQ